MEKIYAVSSATSSVVYGNISCAIREHILSKFPYGYFTDVNMSTEVAFRNIYRKLGGTNSKREFEKRKKPWMNIRPILTPTSPDTFLNDIPLTKNWDNIQYGVDKRYLFDIFKDGENGYSLKYKINRDKLEFDVGITVSTVLQQIDLFKYLYNQISWDRPYSHRIASEAMIPRSIIKHISNLINTDIDDSRNNNVPIMMTYLNGISTYPITYKMRNSTARDEFFMYSNQLINITFSDLDYSDGQMKNMVMDDFMITFRVTAEFFLPGVFYLIGTPDLDTKLKVDIAVKEAYTDHTEFVPLFTLENIYQRFPLHLDGKTLYTSTIFNIEPDAAEVDYLDIAPLFSNETNTIIKQHLKYNNPMDTLFKFIMLKNRDEVAEGDGYSVNWYKLQIELKDLDPDATYRLIVYSNTTKLNSSLVEMAESNRSDKSKI